MTKGEGEGGRAKGERRESEGCGRETEEETDIKERIGDKESEGRGRETEEERDKGKDKGYGERKLDRDYYLPEDDEVQKSNETSYRRVHLFRRLFS